MSASKPAEKSLINSNVVFIDQEMLMQEAVALMIESNISSVLVVDATTNVVGILTERDIVRKFTLLDVADKLTRKVSMLMTRPVSFVHVKTLRKDITKLHMDHKIRHFPVLNGSDPKKANVLGIVSITDLARQALLAPMGDSKSDLEGAVADEKRLKVGVMSSHHGMSSAYIDLFKGMGILSLEVKDIHKFLTGEDADHQALLLDLDGYTDHQQHDLIPIAVKSKGFLILTTSNPNLISIFKKYLNKDRQEIAMKPLDMGYITWMLAKKWHAPG
ncbi:MAG: CBS domain-containing protein [Proteobacteria bacterium]|nr:CBS domain-containing protein [Pseudomonadota bacterium]